MYRSVSSKISVTSASTPGCIQQRKERDKRKERYIKKFIAGRERERESESEREEKEKEKEKEKDKEKEREKERERRKT